MLGDNGAYYPPHTHIKNTPAPPQSRLTLKGGGSGGQSLSRGRLKLLGGGGGSGGNLSKLK